MNCLRLFRFAEQQFVSVTKITSARYYASHNTIRFMETEDIWRQRDGVPKQWRLIYKAPMSTALNIASAYLTVTTGISGLAAIYYGAFVYNAEDLHKPVILGDDIVLANSPTECLTYLGGFVALHVAVNMVLSRYVLRLYQDGDEYLAIYRGYWYNATRTHKFNLNDFKKSNTIVVIPWTESQYNLGKKKGILMEQYFKSPEYFNYLLTKQKINDDND